MASPTICLNMIVKDEAHVIRRCLDSVRPFIDSWVIVDTGSSDGTQQVIREHFAGVPGELHERPWRGFGASRSEAIELARGKADYLFFIDADDVLEFDHGFERIHLDQIAYELDIRYGELAYRRVCLVRSDLPWRWEGVLHEYLECGRSFPRERLGGVRMRILGGGARSQVDAKEKFMRDARTLEAALRQEPDNARYQFYLAQSLRDSGQMGSALAAYERRSAMGGFQEEVYCSLLEAARIAQQLKHPASEVIDHFLRAYECRPTRSEAIVELMKYLRESGQRWRLAYLLGQEAIKLGPSNDSLFVEPEWQAWRAMDELSIAAYWVGDYGQSLALCESLLGGDRLPDEHRARVRANRDFARGKLETSPTR
jgi:tetratricopeptide (TPR) repeat protein